MKRKSKIIQFAIVLAFFGAIVALLEVFNLHPQLSIGKFHSNWVGVRHMNFESGVMTVPVSGGQKIIQRDYGIGPVLIAVES